MAFTGAANSHGPSHQLTECRFPTCSLKSPTRRNQAKGKFYTYSAHEVGGGWRSVWPDVAIKRSQISPKEVTAIFSNKVMFFKIGQKVAKYFGYFCKKSCLQNLSKITQFGRTDGDQWRSTNHGPHLQVWYLNFLFRHKTKHNISLLQGGSPGLVVMGGDSCSKGRQFESRHRILDGHFFTFVCCKNWNVCLKRRK